MKKSIQLFLIILTGALCAQSGTITGRIVDEENKDPLIGANVIIEGTTLGAATDINGKYTILNVPVGAVTLKTTYIGYEEKMVDLTVTLGEIVQADIGLLSEVIRMET